MMVTGQTRQVKTTEGVDMIAMHYRFVLPADYDMAVIRQRIHDKGPLMDDFDGLHLKAYLHASRDDEALRSRENLYAPFYLWRDDVAMQRFLRSPGFSALTQAFGWPMIRCWLVWDALVSPDATQAGFATLTHTAIEPHTDLATLQQDESEQLRGDVGRGALAAISAFEPVTWTGTRLRLWSASPPGHTDAQRYRAGHVSRPTPLN